MVRAGNKEDMIHIIIVTLKTITIDKTIPFCGMNHVIVYSIKVIIVTLKTITVDKTYLSVA